jgi:hypothetical protein
MANLFDSEIHKKKPPQVDEAASTSCKKNYFFSPDLLATAFVLVLAVDSQQPSVFSAVLADDSHAAADLASAFVSPQAEVVASAQADFFSAFSAFLGLSFSISMLTASTTEATTGAVETPKKATRANNNNAFFMIFDFWFDQIYGPIMKRFVNEMLNFVLSGLYFLYLAITD